MIERHDKTNININSSDEETDSDTSSFKTVKFSMTYSWFSYLEKSRMSNFRFCIFEYVMRFFAFKKLIIQPAVANQLLFAWKLLLTFFVLTF